MGLPLLDYTSNLFKEVDFSNVLIISIQHILESNFLMFEYLFKKGLEPSNTFLLGKCYSTNLETLKKFRKKGVYVHEGSLKFQSHSSFDEQFEEIVVNFINEVKNKVNFSDYKKVLLVDDGGFLLYFGNILLENFDNVVAIEQTSSGYNKLRDIKLKFPVINIARSETKLRFESPFIAEVFVKKLDEKIKKYKIAPRKILIVGNGYIGKEISNLLKNKFDLTLYDINEKKSDFEKNKLDKKILDQDLIIGATGSKIIDPNILKKSKRKVILASISSSDREFSAIDLRKQVSLNNDCHKDIIIQNILLLNSGFPLNFDGSKNSVSPEKIQLTRALMYSGIAIALIKKHSIEFVTLEKNIKN